MSMWNLEPGLGHLQWVNRFHFVIRSLVRFSALSCLLIEWARCCCSLHCWNLLFCVRDVHNVCTSSQTCLFSNHRICGSFGHPCTLWRLFLNYCVVVRGEQKWRRQCCNLLHSEQIACPCHKLHQCWKKNAPGSIHDTNPNYFLEESSHVMPWPLHIYEGQTQRVHLVQDRAIHLSGVNHARAKRASQFNHIIWTVERYGIRYPTCHVP